MTTTLCIIAGVLILVSTWFLGLWNNVLTFVNTILAAIIASNYFEPLAATVDNDKSSYTYVLDFVCVWVLFIVSFAVLRVATDTLSKNRLHFDKWLDMSARTVFSVATAWVFICFMSFTFHVAPLPVGVDSFQETPDSTNFVGSPDRLWLGFMHSRSKTALSSSLDAMLVPEYDTSLLHADDADLNCRVFDSKGDFIYKYHSRREAISGMDTLRVAQ